MDWPLTVEGAKELQGKMAALSGLLRLLDRVDGPN